MDFDKIKPAVEGIELSDKQKEDILNACKGRKRKFNYKPLATVAAVLAITLVYFGMTGNLFGAKMANDTGDNYACGTLDGKSYNYLCDDIVQEQVYSVQSSSQTAAKRPIYSIVPTAFSSLVDKDEFSAWINNASEENGMLIVQFVDHFEISKEDFDKANTAYALELEKIYGESACVDPEEGKEYLEIFNSDIIYSFDRTVTDNYYSAK